MARWKREPDPDRLGVHFISRDGVLMSPFMMVEIFNNIEQRMTDLEKALAFVHSSGWCDCHITEKSKAIYYPCKVLECQDEKINE